jgi:hypothetical protein
LTILGAAIQDTTQVSNRITREFLMDAPLPSIEGYAIRNDNREAFFLGILRACIRSSLYKDKNSDIMASSNCH